MVSSFATSFPRINLDELVKISDHILVGEIVKVDMIDKNNNKLHNPKARTGPGLDNEIRLHIKFKEVLSSNKKISKKHLIISLNKARHGNLEGYKDVFEGSSSLFFLKGSNFKRAVSGYFMQPISVKTKVYSILNNNMYLACKKLKC